MSLDARIRELSERHKRLDSEINTRQRQPNSDEAQLHELKRQKLRLKDEIAQLRAN
jgi:hypothetical protein